MIETKNELAKETIVEHIKNQFKDYLSIKLNLTKVSAPLFVESGTGIQDHLNGIETPVSFMGTDHKYYEVVQSLAKWKRLALLDKGVSENKGIITDMKAIRPSEIRTPIHSLYVDQWDWEKVISKNERNEKTLHNTVKDIYHSIKELEKTLDLRYQSFAPILPKEIQFVHTEELLERYPDLTPKLREKAITEELGAVFIQGIGGELKDGTIHDGRSPDYDDWTTETEPGRKGLNGDIVVWNPVLKDSFELSSMGIRVNPEIMIKQLEIRGCSERKTNFWHGLLLDNKLPQSIGGGIGQSRLAMLFMGTGDIMDVQARY